VNIIDLRKTWEKLQLAARVIVAMNNPLDVCAVALTTGQTKQQPLAQRAVLKFSQLTGARHIAGRYTPGTFTNRIQTNFLNLDFWWFLILLRIFNLFWNRLM